MRLRRLQTFANQIHVLLWCLNAFGGLFLETVQNVDPLGDFDRINSTVRVAHVVFNNLLPPTHLMREPMRIRAPWVARAAMFLATVG